MAKKCDFCDSVSMITLKCHKDNKTKTEYYEHLCKSCYKEKGYYVIPELETMPDFLGASSALK